MQNLKIPKFILNSINFGFDSEVEYLNNANKVFYEMLTKNPSELSDEVRARLVLAKLSFFKDRLLPKTSFENSPGNISYDIDREFIMLMCLSARIIDASPNLDFNNLDYQGGKYKGNVIFQGEMSKHLSERFSKRLKEAIILTQIVRDVSSHNVDDKMIEFSSDYKYLIIKSRNICVPISSLSNFINYSYSCYSKVAFDERVFKSTQNMAVYLLTQMVCSFLPENKGWVKYLDVDDLDIVVVGSRKNSNYINLNKGIYQHDEINASPVDYLNDTVYNFLTQLVRIYRNGNLHGNVIFSDNGIYLFDTDDNTKLEDCTAMLKFYNLDVYLDFISRIEKALYVNKVIESMGRENIILENIIYVLTLKKYGCRLDSLTKNEFIHDVENIVKTSNIPDIIMNRAWVLINIVQKIDVYNCDINYLLQDNNSKSAIINIVRSLDNDFLKADENYIINAVIKRCCGLIPNLYNKFNCLETQDIEVLIRNLLKNNAVNKFKFFVEKFKPIDDKICININNGKLIPYYDSKNVYYEKGFHLDDSKRESNKDINEIVDVINANNLLISPVLFCDFIKDRISNLDDKAKTIIFRKLGYIIDLDVASIDLSGFFTLYTTSIIDLSDVIDYVIILNINSIPQSKYREISDLASNVVVIDYLRDELRRDFEALGRQSQLVSDGLNIIRHKSN